MSLDTVKHAAETPDAGQPWKELGLKEDEYARIRDWAKQHCNDPPDVEIALVPILLWSDSTQLTNFGNASMWPIYAFFGFVSKYVRARPNSLSAHHLAYVPKVRGLSL